MGALLVGAAERRARGTERKESRAKAGRVGVREWRRLTHKQAVDVALGTNGAHLEDPRAQQLRVGAVGRCIAVCGTDAAEDQEEGGQQ